jgi:hypothetical protein
MTSVSFWNLHSASRDACNRVRKRDPRPTTISSVTRPR